MDIEKAEFMLRGMDVILARETRGHRTPMARDIEDRCRQSRLSGFNPDAIDEEKGDVWQTPATTKKKQE